MSDDRVGARVDHRAREGGQEGGRRLPRRAVALVAVDRDDDVVGGGLRLPDLRGDCGEVRRIGFGRDAGLLAGREDRAGKLEAVARVRLAAHLARERAEALELVLRHDVGRAHPQRVDPRARGDRAAPIDGAGEVGKRGRGGDEGDRAARSAEDSRTAGLREARAGARLDEPGGGDGPRRRLQPRDAVVPRVIVRARDEVEAGPRKVARELRVGAQRGQGRHRRSLEIVEERLEVRRGGVRVPQQLEERDVVGLVVALERACHDRVARQGDRHRARRLRRGRGARRRQREGDAQGEERRQKRRGLCGFSSRMSRRVSSEPGGVPAARAAWKRRDAGGLFQTRKAATGYFDRSSDGRRMSAAAPTYAQLLPSRVSVLTQARRSGELGAASAMCVSVSRRAADDPASQAEAGAAGSEGHIVKSSVTRSPDVA